MPCHLLDGIERVKPFFGVISRGFRLVPVENVEERMKWRESLLDPLKTWLVIARQHTPAISVDVLLARNNESCPVHGAESLSCVESWKSAG